MGINLKSLLRRKSRFVVVEKHHPKDTVFAPVHGEIKTLDDVPDETFSRRVLGDGFAQIPQNNAIYAPASGTVSFLADTNHAIGIDCAGVELMIHIGVDTVNLKGKGFRPFVKNGDNVEAGQLIIETDFDTLRREGYPTDVILVVIDSENYKLQVLTSAGIIEAGVPVLQVIP